MLALQSKIFEIQTYEILLVKDFVLQQKAYFDLMSMHVGRRANLGYTRLNANNYL